MCWPLLLGLPLLALALFGDCGGGVRSFLDDLRPERRARLRAIVLRRQAERAEARQHLRGAARQDAYSRIEHTTKVRTDSLFYPDGEGSKFRHRRNRIDRQLLRLPAP